MAFRSLRGNAETPGVGEESCDELNNIIDRLEQKLDQARQNHRRKIEQEAIMANTPTKPFFGRFLRRSPSNPPPSPLKTDLEPPSSEVEVLKRDLKPSVEFCEFIDDPNGIIEDLRRMSELAVIGENMVTSLNKKRLALQDYWKNRDELQDFGELELEVEKATEDERLQLFDVFFERNALELMVNLICGDVFAADEEPVVKSDGAYAQSDDEMTDAESTQKTTVVKNDTILLPSVNIATQTIQSISILIQNVSRATSLYVILSNNYINKLVNLDLERYETAERTRQKAMAKEGTLTHTFKSPELSELTTHYITFLKSLAMRMNAETLQFYLTYPTEQDSGQTASGAHFDDEDAKSSGSGPDDEADVRPLSDQPETYKVNFPLYDRALEFCAAHQDSFVRVTALNICLNTLRLATIVGDKDEKAEVPDVGSPNGVLHSTVLPFRERLAIAQHTCAPVRVEKLVAPMFSKLAERWNALQEAIKEIDADIARGLTSSTKVGQAKEKVKRQRLLRTFRDKSDDLQDEMLHLEDVFKVGLTVLNEQTIEMMLATFVYPLLLQPLLLYYQRFDATVDRSRNEKIYHPFGSFGGDFSHADSALAPVASAAKTALYTLASVFHICTNRPLLRIMYTSLFHPFSPDSGSVPTIRSKLEVAACDRNGDWLVRVDPVESNADENELIPNDRSTYSFGTNLFNRRRRRSNAAELERLEGTEACVFVLAPALAEILEFRGEDFALVARTRPNPYRRALLQCLDVPHEMDEMRQLSSCLFDAALSRFDGEFAADIMFGLDIKSCTDDIPIDERNLDSTNAYTMDDRGIGGGMKYESRTSLAGRGVTSGADLTAEVVSALCGSAIYASKDSFGGFHISYDDVAAHALLSSIRSNARSMLMASKIVDARWRQAAAFLARRAIDLHNTTGGGATFLINGSPKVNSPNFEEEVLGGIMDAIFFQTQTKDGKAAMETFKEVKSETQDDRSACSTAMAHRSSFKSMRDVVGSQLCTDAPDLQYDLQQLVSCQDSAEAIARMSSLHSFLRDLVATGGTAIRGVQLQGIAIGLFGKITDMSDCFTGNLNREVYGPISPDMSSAVFSDAETPLPALGSVIPLVGRLALPFVCEVQPSLSHLFRSSEENGSSVVSEGGVIWQSLYLAFLDECLVVVQPNVGDPGAETGAGEGIVISAAWLERISAAANPQPDPSSPARRLTLSYKWFDMVTPPLFMFDELPERRSVGPLVCVDPFTSTVDLWFESQRASEQALQILNQSTFAAKSQRGRRVFNFLTPGEFLKPKEEKVDE